MTERHHQIACALVRLGAVREQVARTSHPAANSDEAAAGSMAARASGNHARSQGIIVGDAATMPWLLSCLVQRAAVQVTGAA